MKKEVDLIQTGHMDAQLKELWADVTQYDTTFTLNKFITMSGKDFDVKNNLSNPLLGRRSRMKKKQSKRGKQQKQLIKVGAASSFVSLHYFN